MQKKEKYRPYPKYKASEVGWIGEIPDEWKGKRFRFLFSFNNGLNITKENLQDEGIPCVSYGEIHSKYGFQVDPEKNELKCVDKKYIETSSKSLLKYGDFVFADTSEDIEGSGNFTYLNGNSATFAGYHTIITRPVENFIHRYVAYLFDSLIYRTQIRSEVSGIKVYSITKNILKDTIVILPPIPEQQAIATFLDRETDRINGIIDKQTQMIDLLKEKRSALITKAVTKGLDPNAKMKTSVVDWIGEIPEGWKVTNLKRVLEQKITDGPHETPELIPDGIPFISAESIKNNQIDFDLRRGNISQQLHYEYCKKAKPKLHDIFFIKSGATTGNIAYVDTTDEFSIWSPLALIRCDENNLFYKYLFYLMLSNEFKTQVELAWSYGTQQNIGMGVIGRLLIILPKLPEQMTIAAFLDSETAKIDTMISKIEKQIELLNEYKQSLITHAVTGKIDVRGEAA